MRAAFREHLGDEATERAKSIEFVPPDYDNRLLINSIFARQAPLEVDIGTGEGGFLEAMARLHPERNFLGMEKLLGRVRKVCRNLAAAGLENARMMRIESGYAMYKLMPRNSITVAHVAFPDPWPAYEHRHRRLIRDAFLQALHAALVPTGELRVKTDDEAYFKWMEKVFARAQGFQRVDWIDAENAPLTNFEQRYVAEGRPIHKARLVKL